MRFPLFFSKAGGEARQQMPILAFALIGISTVLALSKAQFLTSSNLVNIARQISIAGPLAVGSTVVLLTGGVDLSLGSMVALAGVVTALSGQMMGLEAGIFVPVVAGVLTAACGGFLNGLIITRARVAPFIVTLGMMTAARGLALVLSEGRPVSGLSPAFLHLATGSLFHIPNPVLVFTVVALAVHVFLRKIRWGRYLYAVGGNEVAAFASGISLTGTKLLAYTLAGITAGITGVVLTSRTTTGQPNAGVGYELDAIAAAVIGGTSLAGGSGGIGGTVLGAILIGVINNGLDLTNVPSYYQQIVKGTIIVGAVALDQRRASSR